MTYKEMMAELQHELKAYQGMYEQFSDDNKGCEACLNLERKILAFDRAMETIELFAKIREAQRWRKPSKIKTQDGKVLLKGFDGSMWLGWLIGYGTFGIVGGGTIESEKIKGWQPLEHKESE